MINVSESPTQAIPTAPKSERPCLVCSYEDRSEAMDSVLLMGESRVAPIPKSHCI